MANELSLKEAFLNILNGLQSERQWREAGEGFNRMRKSLPGVAESVVRGGVAAIPGQFGDISEFVRSASPELVEKVLGKRIAPTTREILDYVPRFTPTHEGATTLEDVGSAIGPGVGGVIKDLALLSREMPVGMMMIGPESKLWKPEMAFQAAKMESKGVPADEIHKATGMVRGLDNQWRQEISDNLAFLKGGNNYGETVMNRMKALEKDKTAEPVTLEDIFYHPKLSEAYPDLMNTEVQFTKKGSQNRGELVHKDNGYIIRVNPDLPAEQAKSTILHEVQHAIQNEEEWNRGANAQQILQKHLDKQKRIDEELTKLNHEMKFYSGNPEYADKYLETMARRDKVAKEYSYDPYADALKEYRNYGGEAESRLTQSRMKLSDEERLQNFPYQYAPEKYGLDINPDEAIIATKHNQTINQPLSELETKGFQDEGNYRRVGTPQSNLERFGITGNEQTRLPGGLIENAGRITRGSHPDDIKKQAELIQANLSNPEFNKALALAKQHNAEFDLKAIADMPESSLQKQHIIGKTYDLLTKESVSPQLKQAIFNDYLEKHPDLIKKEGITDYDDLVTKSYGQLRKEVDKQFDDMVKSGIKMSFHQGDANYLDSKEMLRDALINNHLYTYRGGDVHPYLNEFDPYYGLNTNEKFRAVHDYLGHATTGSTFGRKGEEIAYGAHAQTLSPLARIAAAAETRGQNSFVNYSGINAELEKQMMATRIARDHAVRNGESPEKYDQILRDLGGQWQYAKQQGVALPPEMLDINYTGNVPEYIKANLFPEHGVSSKGYHYSNLSDLEETDPSFYGKGIRGAEHKRLILPGAVKDRTYFYNEPGMREPGLGKYQYEADLEHLYDVENDPANIVKMSENFNRDKYGNLDIAGKANDMERLIKEAGYHGYFNNKTGVGISFEPQKVREYSSD